MFTSVLMLLFVVLVTVLLALLLALLMWVLRILWGGNIQFLRHLVHLQMADQRVLRVYPSPSGTRLSRSLMRLAPLARIRSVPLARML